MTLSFACSARERCPPSCTMLLRRIRRSPSSSIMTSLGVTPRTRAICGRSSSCVGLLAKAQRIDLRLEHVPLDDRWSGDAFILDVSHRLLLQCAAHRSLIGVPGEDTWVPRRQREMSLSHGVRWKALINRYIETIPV